LGLVLAIALPAPHAATAVIVVPYSTLHSQSIAPGVRHEVGMASASNGGASIHVVRADLASSW
jgi:hypothetical protein